MFGTKTAENDPIIPTSGGCSDQKNVKVLKLDFKPSKVEEQLAVWVDQGWTLKSTEMVSVGGTTMFLLAFLDRS